MAERRARRGAGTLILAALGLAGWLVFFLLHHEAFPYASLDLKVDGRRAMVMARELLQRRSISVEGWRSSVSFHDDGAAREFLERTLGAGAANDLMRERVSVWCWKVRFFRSFQKEEVEVDIAPDGRLVGFTHTLPEAAASPGKPAPGRGVGDVEERARRVAREFLALYAPEASRLILRERDATRRVLPGRTDCELSWRAHIPEAPSLDYRIEVVVSDAVVTSFGEYLKVPENFRRQKDQEESKGDLLAQIAGFLTFLVAVAAPLLALRWLRGVRFRYRLPLILGVTCGGFLVLNGVNSWPLIFSRYDTSGTLGSFLAASYLAVLLEGLMTVVLLMFSGTLGDRMQSAGSPGCGRLAPGELFTVRGLLSAEAMRAVAAGVPGAGAVLGWQTLFYLAGQRYFGAYVPAEVPYQDILSTAMPWLYPLVVGLTAGLSEEILFRLLGVNLFRRLTGSTLLALIIPGALWAFMHCNYPQQPFYIRGIELTAVGIFWGWLSLRWGILASITAHYLFNSFLGAMTLMASHDPALRVAGLAVVLLPAALPLARLAVIRLTGRAIPLPEPEEAPPAHEPVIPPPPAVEYETPAALAPRARRALWAVGAVGLLAFVFFPAPRLGDGDPPPVERRRAVALAKERLYSAGVDAGRYRPAAALRQNVDYFQARYLVRTLGTAQADRLLGGLAPPTLWYVRFFRPGEKEEYLVKLRTDGSFFAFNHLLDEDARGGSLSREEALARARALLAKSMDGSPRAANGGWRLVEGDVRRRTRRTDYDFRFESDAVRVGEAALRVDVQVKGAEALNFYPWFKLPEELLHRQMGRSFKDVFIIAVFIAAGILLFLKSLRVISRFVVELAQRRRIVIALSAGLAALSLAGRASSWPSLLFDFDTAQSLSAFALAATLQAATWGLFVFFVAAFLLCLVESLFRSLYHRDAPPLASFESPRVWATLRDNLALACGACGAALGLGEAALHLREALLRPVLSPLFKTLPFADSWMPALGIAGTALGEQALLLLAGAALVLMLLHTAARPLPRLLVVAAAAAMLSAMGAKSLPEMAASFGSSLLTCLFFWAACRLALGARIPAYALWYGLIPLVSLAVPLAVCGDALLAANGALVLLGAAVAAVALWRRAEPV